MFKWWTRKLFYINSDAVPIVAVCRPPTPPFPPLQCSIDSANTDTTHTHTKKMPHSNWIKSIETKCAEAHVCCARLFDADRVRIKFSQPYPYPCSLSLLFLYMCASSSPRRSPARGISAFYLYLFECFMGDHSMVIGSEPKNMLVAWHTYKFILHRQNPHWCSFSMCWRFTNGFT